ncbi:MAG: tetratricopeptide repeat protein [Deltaproteobacteria bacterium]|nr:tetratricopeptide repeat protein [Deltaproteobacteria bacterium]
MADEPEAALKAASEQVASVAQDAGSVETAVSAQSQAPRGPQQRIAEATLLMGVKDYDRAADVLNEVVEQFPNHPTAYPDGLNLLGETYFLAKQYLSAQRIFLDLVKRGNDSRFAPYRERAAIRVVDTALRTRNFEPLEALFSTISSLKGEASSGIAYARGKGLLAQGKLDGSEAALRSVASDSAFYHQARYLLGVLATTKASNADVGRDDAATDTRKRKALYEQAVARFQETTKLPGDTAEHRHVVDLAWLAIARILYDTSQLAEAAEAYGHVESNSPEFMTMLYEAAWVYVKMGDVDKAKRKLERLRFEDQRDADPWLLEADLKLRSGQFVEAAKLFEGAKADYIGQRDKVVDFMKVTSSPAEYFKLLSADQLELSPTSKALPTNVLNWVREGEDGPTAFAVIDDVVLCRRLLKESNEMIERVNAVLASPNKIRALPGLRLNYERGLGLQNAIGVARMKLAAGLDGIDERPRSAALKEARQRRKSLEGRHRIVPTSAADFAKRDTDAKGQWNKPSQDLKRLELQIDMLQATINGLERVLSDGPAQGVVRPAREMEKHRSDLDEQKRMVASYREGATQLRSIIEAAKLQVGFGDRRFEDDRVVRLKYAEALAREVSLSMQPGEPRELQDYAGRALQVLGRADETERKIEASLVRLTALVESKVAEFRSVVKRETTNVTGFEEQLKRLDDDARVVVGQVAMRNFGAVRDRLRNIVLRADVGIAEEAWEVREAQQTRVRRLKIEKARKESRLQEELDEVLDDSGDGDQEKTNGQ